MMRMMIAPNDGLWAKRVKNQQSIISGSRVQLRNGIGLGCSRASRCFGGAAAEAGIAHNADTSIGAADPQPGDIIRP
jgi:hypothetical protein